MISFWNADPDELPEESIILRDKQRKSEVTFSSRNGTAIATGLDLRIDVFGIDPIGKRLAIPREQIPGHGNSSRSFFWFWKAKRHIVVTQLDSWQLFFFSYLSCEEIFQRGDRIALGLIDDEILVAKNYTSERTFVFNDPAFLKRLPTDDRRWKPYHSSILLLVLGFFLFGLVLLVPAGMNDALRFRSLWIAILVASFFLFILWPMVRMVWQIKKDLSHGSEQIAKMKLIIQRFSE
jgi:hypothetical protein